MPTRSTAEVIDLFNRAFLEQAPELLTDLVDDGCVMESVQPAPTGERVEGGAACLKFWQTLVLDQTSQFTPQEVIVAGDRATIRWQYRFGPSADDWVEGVNLMWIHDGRIIEALGYSKSTGDVPLATDEHTLTLIAGFTAEPGQEQTLRDALNAMVEPSLAEYGCLAYHPYTDPNRPGRMIIVEEWTSEAALENHFSLPHFKQISAILDEILAEPFTLRRLTDHG